LTISRIKEVTSRIKEVTKNFKEVPQNFKDASRMVQGSFKDQGTFRRETAPIINNRLRSKIIRTLTYKNHP
jgi:hypothetical protein